MNTIYYISFLTAQGVLYEFWCDQEAYIQLQGVVKKAGDWDLVSLNSFPRSTCFTGPFQASGIFQWAMDDVRHPTLLTDTISDVFYAPTLCEPSLHLQGKGAASRLAAYIGGLGGYDPFQRASLRHLPLSEVLSHIAA